MILHARRIVVGLHHLGRDERPACHFRGEDRKRDFTSGGEDAGAAVGGGTAPPVEPPAVAEPLADAAAALDAAPADADGGPDGADVA